MASRAKAPIQQAQRRVEGDTVRLRLYEDTEAEFRVELRREYDDESIDRWVFGVTEEQIAKYRTTSTVDDLAATPDIPEWVEELLLESEVQEVEV